MKHMMLIVIFSLLIGTLVGCDFWDYRDPERKIINDRLHIITHCGEIALLKKGLQIEEGDEIIIQKNFVAYSLYEDYVVLCEEKDDGSQVFWTYGIQSEELREYPSYAELNQALSGHQLEWKTLWVQNFAIKDAAE